MSPTDATAAAMYKAVEEARVLFPVPPLMNEKPILIISL